MVICGFDLGIIERALARDHVQARLPPAARLVGPIAPRDRAHKQHLPSGSS
jgi:hypothetical protein